MILGIETSTRICSIGIYHHQLSVEETSADAFNHSENLLPAIHKLINDHGFKLKEFRAIGVSIGPGSYTGLRIGLSTAKGLAVAWKIPVIPVDTLEGIVSSDSIRSDDPFIILVYSHGELAYHQQWKKQGDKPEPLDELQMDPLSTIMSRYKGKFEIYSANMPSDRKALFQEITPSGLAIASIAATRFSTASFPDIAELEPRYFSTFKAVKWNGYKKSRNI